MDTTMNYPGFDRDIKDAFAPLVKEYAFIFFKVYDGCYELKNPHCILRFTYDRGDVSCNIRQVLSVDPYGDGVFPILRYLSPKDETFGKEKLYDPRLILFEYAEILRTKLKNVIQGDFSWLGGFLKQKERTSKLIGFIWDTADKNSPIYIKFKNGDMSWQKDLEEYLLKNNITL